MSSEEIYSVVSAAKLTGYSVPTIRKRLDVLAKAGAVQDDRQWKIPLAALHVAGLMKKVEEQTFRSVSSESLQGSTVTTMQALQGQLNEALRRAEVAEAVAAERLTALERADRAMLILEDLQRENDSQQAVQRADRAVFMLEGSRRENDSQQAEQRAEAVSPGRWFRRRSRP